MKEREGGDSREVQARRDKPKAPPARAAASAPRDPSGFYGDGGRAEAASGIKGERRTRRGERQSRFL